MQRVAHEAQHLRIVVHHEDARPLPGARRRGAPASRPARFAARLRGDRQREGEPRALARPGALGPDAPAVGLHQPLADGQPQPATDTLLVVAGVAVFPEQARQALRRQAAALVHDRDRDMRAVALGRDPDRRGLGRATRGVGEQVVQHLHDALPVGHHAGQALGEVDAHRVPAVAGKEGGPRLLDQLPHLGGLGRHRERAGVDPSRVEQVAEQPAHAVGLLVDDAEELPHLRRAEGLRRAQHRRGGTLDGGERRAQLVTHHPQEIRPHPVKGLERPQILQGDHHRLDRAVRGVDRGRIDERGDAAPVGGREHDFFGAHRSQAAQLLGQPPAVEDDLAPVGEAARHLLEQVLDRAAGRAQGLEEAPCLAVDRGHLGEPGIEDRDADRGGLQQGFEVGAGALLGAVGAGVDDGRRGLRGEQQQHLLVGFRELRPALLVQEVEVADMRAEVAHRRAEPGADQRQLPGEPQRAHEAREVGDPQRARQVPELLEELRPVGPLLGLAVLVLAQSRRHEGIGRPRLVDGGDAAAARFGQRAGAIDHLAQHGLEVEARADAQQRLALRGHGRPVGCRDRGGGVGGVGHRLVPGSCSAPCAGYRGVGGIGQQSPDIRIKSRIIVIHFV